MDALKKGKMRGRNMGRRKRIRKCYFGSCILLLSFFLLTGYIQVNAEDSVEMQQISSYSDISELISDTWDENYFGKIILDSDTGKMEKDGVQIDFNKEFDVESSEKNAVIQSEDSLEEYFDNNNGDNIYETTTNEDGDIEITAPFQTKRLIVDQNLMEDYGAQSIFYNQEDQEMILQFDTQIETKNAYDKICTEYGTEVCHPDEIYYLNDILMETGAENVSSTSWGNSYMGMDVLKSKAPTAGYHKAVTVAVLDTGIDRSNAMFQSRTISSKSYNIADHNCNIEDNHGHGTHVSGVIVDATPANVHIMMLKIANRSGYSSLLTIRTALQYAVKKKADVINMSVGFVSVQADECTYLNAIIKKAYEKGIPIVAAAGNNAVDVNYCYPACDTRTIAVSALNAKEQLAYYSNRGKKIDFCAPGSDIVSAKAKGDVVSMTGTSMAAPHISAAIAYVKMMQSNLSVAGVYQELKSHCKDLGKSGKDTSYGWGCPIITDLFDTGILNPTKVVTVQSSPQLKSVKNTKNGVKISWKKIGNAEKYLIYRKRGSGTYKRIATVSSKKTTYLDKKTSQGIPYTYGVKVVKSKKTSGLSNAKTIVSLKQIKKTSAKARKGKKVVLYWKKQKNVTGYQIRFATKKLLKKSKVITVSKKSTKMVRKGLKKKVYCYQIRSYKKTSTGISYSPWSSVKKVKVS